MAENVKPLNPENQPVQIEKGQILIYRIFDVASEIHLDRLASDTAGSRDIAKPTGPKFVDRPSVIQVPHFAFNLDPRQFKSGGRDFLCDIQVKVREFGAVSIVFSLPIPKGTSWTDLVSLSASIEKGQGINEQAQAILEVALKRIQHAMVDPSPSRIYEDYTIFFVEQFSGAQTIDEMLTRADVPALLWAERDFRLSRSSRRAAQKNNYQYADNDLVIVEWNAALVVEPSGSLDVPEVIEFSLSHLLEIRYYDDLLDSRLRSLYSQIGRAKQQPIFGGRFDRIYRESSARFIEFMEFTERVDNAFKVTGDFYLATIYRAAIQEFRMQDWQDSVTRKINTLGQVSSLLQGEVNYRKSHLLEVIIVLLILYEVVAAIFH